MISVTSIAFAKPPRKACRYFTLRRAHSDACSGRARTRARARARERVSAKVSGQG